MFREWYPVALSVLLAESGVELEFDLSVDDRVVAYVGGRVIGQWRTSATTRLL
jgi:hypothetical protein